jgi:uncharacterized UPF0160 family protein
MVFKRWRRLQGQRHSWINLTILKKKKIVDLKTPLSKNQKGLQHNLRFFASGIEKLKWVFFTSWLISIKNKIWCCRRARNQELNNTKAD